MATIQLRKKKKGGCNYRVMIRSADGHPPVSKTFPSKQEAKDWAKDEEARRRQATYFPEQNTGKKTLGELIDQYITIALPNKPKNAKDARRHLTWWKSKLGNYRLSLITPNILAQYRNELGIGITTKGTQRSPATVNRYLASLSAALTYGVKECGWLPNNPALRVSKLKEPFNRDRVLTQEECQRLLKECKASRNPYLFTIVMIAISSGMRQGEILSLTWNDVDILQRTIFIRDSKNGKPRAVAIVEEVVPLLTELALNRNPHTPYIFFSKKIFSKIDIRKAWNEARKRAGIDIRFHDLRHTFCTYAAQSGASTMELATAMGHSSLQMLQRYTHMNVKHTKKLSKAVTENLIGGHYGQKQASEAS